MSFEQKVLDLFIDLRIHLLLENAELGDHFLLRFRVHRFRNTDKQTHGRIVRFGQFPKFRGDGKQGFDAPHVFRGKTHHIGQIILIGDAAIHSSFCLFECFTVPVAAALPDFVQPLHFPNDGGLLEMVGVDAPALADVGLNEAAENFVLVFELPDDAGHIFHTQLQGGTGTLPAADNSIVFGNDQRVHDAYLSDGGLKFIPLGTSDVIKKFLVAGMFVQRSGIFQNDFLSHSVPSSKMKL